MITTSAPRSPALIEIPTQIGLGKPTWFPENADTQIHVLKREASESSMREVSLIPTKIVDCDFEGENKTRLQYADKKLQMTKEPGMHYLPAPPKTGYVVRQAKGDQGFDYNLISDIEIIINQFYKRLVFESYTELNLAEKHPDLLDRAAPTADLVLPEEAQGAEGTYHFSIIAALGTNEEWREGLSILFNIDQNSQLNGFAIFGEDTKKDYPCYYVAQMGSDERGLGTKFMNQIIEHIKAEKPNEKVALHIGTRFGNLPAEKLYGTKFNMDSVPPELLRETMGLDPFHEDGRPKYVGFKTMIEGNNYQNQA